MKLNLIKKSGVLLIIALIFVSFYAKAQNPSYNQLFSIVSSKMPALNLSNKLIAFSSWSAADAVSRGTNKEFDRVGTIYQVAKLRNGSNGVVLISCYLDSPSTATIAFNRDNISYAIRVNRSEFAFLNSMTLAGNIVYDNTGAKVYENLNESQVFSSFNQLITR